MIKRSSKHSPRPIRPLTERELVATAGGLSEEQQQLDWIAAAVDKGIYYNNMGGGLLGVKTLTIGD